MAARMCSRLFALCHDDHIHNYDDNDEEKYDHEEGDGRDYDDARIIILISTIMRKKMVMIILTMMKTKIAVYCHKDVQRYSQSYQQL